MSCEARRRGTSSGGNSIHRLWHNSHDGATTMAVKKKTRPSAAKAAAQLTRYSKGEHIKVAPLHSPKPAMSIDELGTVKQEQSDTKLFDGAMLAATPQAHIAHLAGPLASHRR